MADTSFFDKVFPNGIGSAIGFPDSETFGKTVETVRDLPTDVLEFLRSVEPDTSIPLTVSDKIKQDFFNIPNYIGKGALGSAEGIDALLSADSPIVAGLQDGSLNEENYNLDGVDLVQVLGDNFGPRVPEEFKMVRPGQSNISDPTGSGRIKARPGTMGEFEVTGKKLEPYDPTGGIQTINPELQSEAFGDLEFELEKEKQREIDAVNFRKQEEKLTQGGLNSMTIEESDKINAESKKMTQEQQEEGFLSAMDDFFEGARGAGPEVPKDRTIAEYKKAFSEATGIDTSGKVDKKDALMAFGLALMQNKAGKGLNVGKMLESVGEAGDKALPALEKAKERARQGALAGGKYALQTQSSDKAVRAAAEEKMLNRDNYWVYKKGTADQPFEGFDTGQFEDLNKYELDKLMKDPKFQEQYDYISKKDRMDILKTRADATLAASDFGDEWSSKGHQDVSLIGGLVKETPSAFIVQGVPRDPNYKGPKTGPRMRAAESDESIIRRFQREQENINSSVDTFDNLMLQVSEGISAPKQAWDGAVGFLRAVGFTGLMPTSTAEAKRILQNFSIDNATEILKESGKTLSDGDRKLVERRVGKIDFFNADPAILTAQIKDIFKMIVTKSQNNLDDAVQALGDDYQIFVTPVKQPAPSEAELVQLNTARAAQGKPKLTMESFSQ